MNRDDPRGRILLKILLSLALGGIGFTVNRLMPGLELLGLNLTLFPGGLFPVLTAIAWGPVYSLPASLLTGFAHFFRTPLGSGASLYLFLSNILWVYLVGRTEEKRKWSDGYILASYFLLLFYALFNIMGYFLFYPTLAGRYLGWKSLLILSYQDNISLFTCLNLAYLLQMLAPVRSLLGMEELPRRKLRSGHYFLLATLGGMIFFFLLTWGMQILLDGVSQRGGSLIFLNLLNLNIVVLLAIVLYLNWDLQSDITRKISERGDILTMLLSSISEGILVLDGDWKVRFANRAALLLGSYSRKDLGKRIDRIVFLHSPETGKPLSPGSIMETLLTGKPFNCLLARKDGTYRRIVITLTVLPRSRSGYAYLSLIRDITEEYEQEQKNIHRQKQEAIGRLVGGVAHDFNNRLAGIMGFAQLISREAPSDTIADYADQITESAQSAADLTSQLLTISRKRPIQHRNLSLNDLAGGTLAVLKHTISKGVKIVFLPSPDNPQIRGDKSLLENSLINLALNGADAMGGRGTLTIGVSLFPVDSSYSLRSSASLPEGMYGRIGVSDTGAGIPRDLLEKIFDPFFTTKPEGEGTGLGLSSVKEIVEKHQGEITVSSRPGKGATFVILLPLAQEETRA